MTYTTQRIRMARKAGEVFTTDDFTQETIHLSAPQAGELLVKARYISLDPYLAGMMQSWQGPQQDWSQGIIVGRMTGQVVESNDPGFAVGDWVFGDSRWQEYERVKAKNLQKITVNEQLPGSAYLGVLGASGLTAWVGVRRVLTLKAGQTLTVSSAAGTVGAIAGQLAKSSGATVIGIAGGQKKCQEVVEQLGFDACIDYKTPTFEADLAAALPSGVDLHFENVGASMLDPVLANMNDYGQIALCGLIQHYFNDEAICLDNFRKLLVSGLRLTGFRVFDYLDATEQAMAELSAGIGSGDIALRETLTEGIANAPEAYIAMLSGRGAGKHLISMPT